ncbi:MAG: glycosyltransferase family 9 protein [Firmicutes bacterium]|nr:glycosyltransferase family 9 protein [Bacillota bacterium]
MKILLCRYTQIGSRGDMLLATPVFKALKERYPQCHITVYTAPHLAVIIKGNPYIDEITCKMPSKFKFDRIIYLDYIKLSNVLHIIDAFGINAHLKLIDKKPYIYLGKEHLKEAKRFRDTCGIHKHDLAIAIHMGPTWPERMWFKERYIEVAEYFKRHYNAKFIELSQFEGMGMGIGIDITGKTSIHQTAAILKGCKLLLCVDSFVLHLASAVDTPTVALFGCTNPQMRLPFNDVSIAPDTPSKCRYCYHWDQTRLSNLCIRDRIYCMESITSESVIQAMEELLIKTGSIK